MMVKAAKFSVLLVFFAALCLTAPPAQAAGFAGQAKIATPNILDDLDAGKETVKVIVMLAGQGANKTLLETQGRSSLPSIRSRVVKTQNAVLKQVSSSEVVVRHMFENINAFSAEVTEAGLKQLAAIGAVVQIEDDFKVKAKTRQGIPQMGGSPYWNSGNHTGSGIAVAVMDTGITRYHSAFTQGGWNKVLGGWNFVDNTSSFSDGNGHGTACAGIIAGFAFDNGDYMGGVAPGAALYGLKVLGDDGSGDLSWTVAAIDWAITHQYDNINYPIMVLSASLGGGFSTAACDDQMSAMAAAANAAKAAGIIFFAASGNEGYCDGMAAPACVSGAVSVGAVWDYTGGVRQDCFDDNSCLGSYNASCLPYGLTRYAEQAGVYDSVIQYSNSASFLDILAPSECVTTSNYDGGWRTCFNGTSAATPYAAGAAAVLQGKVRAETGAYLTPDQLLTRMKDYGDCITDPKSGYTTPRVNLKQSIEMVGGGGCSGSPTPPPTGGTTYWGIVNDIWCLNYSYVGISGTINGETKSSWTNGPGTATWEGYEDTNAGNVTFYYSISGCGLDTSSSWTPTTVFEANNCYYFFLTVSSGQSVLQLYRSTDCTKPFSVTSQGFERNAGDELIAETPLNLGTNLKIKSSSQE